MLATPSFYEGRLTLHLERALLGASAGPVEMAILRGQNPQHLQAWTAFLASLRQRKKDDQGALAQGVLSAMMYGCPLGGMLLSKETTLISKRIEHTVYSGVYMSVYGLGTQI